MACKCRLGTKLRICIILIVVSCLCLDNVKGSCLSYGHSCWGAHGKRASPPGRTVSNEGSGALQFKPQPLLDQSNPLPAALTTAERWALVRVLPEKNIYNTFSKVIHSPPALPAASLIFNDDLGLFGADPPTIKLDSINSAIGTSVDTSYDPKTPASTEQDLVVGDERLLAAIASPNERRRDHRQKKKGQSTSTRKGDTRFGGIDDSYDDNMSLDRNWAPNNDDIGQMLLLNAAAAAASAISDNDATGATTQFKRKLFNGSTKISLPLNA
ncbi:uncharacterized protein LOC128731958 [Anopheles nili]|uniref:uncharacterized protein LOC128731958 n=1 Tax=Anopheles nili TaxID=185578 RepID=UPI00237AA7D6|nr:uncharacterized protein LOC128731958 [Anopheles nili]